MTFEEWKNTRAYDILSDIEFKQWIYDDDMTDDEKEKYPSYKTTGGYLKTLSRKEAVSNWWKNLDNYDKQEIFNLPNFDLKIFNEIMEIKITKKEYNEVMKQC